MRTTIAASFMLFLLCPNCMRTSSKQIDVPNAEDAPQDIDELSESAFLANQAFGCVACESAIGEIVAIKKLRCALAA